jgi:hypothetical protein
MDNELLKKLAHLKILLKRNGGIAVDITQLIADPAYARDLLTKAEEIDSEEIVLLALDLKDKLGLLTPPPAASTAPAKAAADEEKPKSAQKYVLGARG